MCRVWCPSRSLNSRQVAGRRWALLSNAHLARTHVSNALHLQNRFLLWLVAEMASGNALEVCKQLLVEFRIPADMYQIGRTKLFFRAGVLGHLEDTSARLNRCGRGSPHRHVCTHLQPITAERGRFRGTRSCRTAAVPYMKAFLFLLLAGSARCDSTAGKTRLKSDCRRLACAQGCAIHAEPLPDGALPAGVPAPPPGGGGHPGGGPRGGGAAAIWADGAGTPRGDRDPVTSAGSRSAVRIQTQPRGGCSHPDGPATVEGARLRNAPATISSPLRSSLQSTDARARSKPPPSLSSLVAH